MDEVSPKLDFSAVRVHFTARLIVLYCRQGVRKDYLRPILHLADSPVFHYTVGQNYFPYPSGYKDVVENLLRLWPEESVDQFYPFPVIQLLKRHSLEEQNKIFKVLKAYYGFIW